jgi:large subunit ribosomal protein L29
MSYKKDINQMSNDVVKEKIVLLKKELMNLRFQKTSGELKKFHFFKQARRKIACLKTLLNQRSINKIIKE